MAGYTGASETLYTAQITLQKKEEKKEEGGEKKEEKKNTVNEQVNLTKFKWSLKEATWALDELIDYV